MAELKPCPFCGGKVSVVLCDDEGNLHDEAYREHLYSGLGFKLHHAHEDNPECPIASYECNGGILGGVYIYDTEEQAVEAWNRRINDGKAEVAQAKWILDRYPYLPARECSRCAIMIPRMKQVPEQFWQYCPNCGARMDGEAE